MLAGTFITCAVQSSLCNHRYDGFFCKCWFVDLARFISIMGANIGTYVYGMGLRRWVIM